MNSLAKVARSLSCVGLLRPVPAMCYTRRTLPSCVVEANVAVSNQFEQAFSKKVAEMLNKPERLMSVTVKDGLRMCRDGSNAPTATVNIWSVGVFDSDRNPGYTVQLYDFFKQHLDIPPDRIALFFHPLERHQAGHLLYADLQQHKS